MKQYIYTHEEAGLKQWPEGQLRLEGIEVTTDPAKAELFTVPGPLTQLFPNREALLRLPYMKDRAAQHVLFDCSDNEPLYSLPCLFIRCNTRTWYHAKDVNTISWPWPVDDYAECIPVPEGGFKYDVGFHGWITSHESRRICFETMTASNLKCDLVGYKDFTGYIWDTPEGHRRREEFRRSLKESRIALCPESINGVFPYRFFEAMSAGRIPMLVGNDFVLPFAEEIPYQAFCIFVPREQACSVDSIAKSFLEWHPDADLIAKGQLARQCWEKLLCRDNWPALMACAVNKKLGLPLAC